MSVTQVKNETFTHAVIDMDNKRFFGCKFKDCMLRYAGGQCEWDEYTSFEACTWLLQDAAQRTVVTLMETGALQFQDKFSLKGKSR
jgi:hypothetical protein